MGSIKCVNGGGPMVGTSRWWVNGGGPMVVVNGGVNYGGLVNREWSTVVVNVVNWWLMVMFNIGN